MSNNKSEELILEIAKTQNSKEEQPKARKDALSKENKSSSISIRDIRKQKGIQNLEERKQLLSILKRLFGIQLVFMNAIVAVLAVWVVFKIPFFNEVEPEVLKEVMSFVRFYITAVLVELLGGIIYITHKVFSEKLSDSLDKV